MDQDPGRLVDHRLSRKLDEIVTVICNGIIIIIPSGTPKYGKPQGADYTEGHAKDGDLHQDLIIAGYVGHDQLTTFLNSIATKAADMITMKSMIVSFNMPYAEKNMARGISGATV